MADNTDRFVWSPEDIVILDEEKEPARYNKVHGAGGKFASTGGSGISDAKADGLAKEAAAPEGGFTYDVKSGEHITAGYAVSPYPEHTRIVPAPLLTGKDIQSYAAEKKTMLAKPGHKLGAWNDNGKVYLDVTIVAGSKSQGAAIGKAHNQKAMYDLKTGNPIPLGGSGLASYSDAEERGFFNRVDRSVTKGATACTKCAVNTDPKNVPIHPGCHCDIKTDAVALGMDPDEFAGVQSQFSDAVAQAIGDVPGATMQPELAARFDGGDFRFGDLTTWLGGLAATGLVCALLSDSLVVVAAAGLPVEVAVEAARADKMPETPKLFVVMFRADAPIEDIARAYRIINEG